jgi:hypothetical protein
MSARPIGEIIAPVIADAIGLGNLQAWLDELQDRSFSNRLWWIIEWQSCGAITPDEADLLIEHNHREAA